MDRATLAAGRYLAHDAARLVGVPGDRVGQWARWGHIRASVSAGEPHVYSFGDVAEALAVHLLLDAGFTLPVLRRAVQRLSDQDGWPLSGGGVHVVGGGLAIERGDVLEDVFTDHGVLPLDGRLQPADLVRRGGWPARVLSEPDSVEVDPQRLGGRPALRGRRVPVEDAVADPDGLGCSEREVAAARRWWAEAERCAS